MTSLGEWVAFGAIGGLILLSGILAVSAKRTFHSVVFLGAALISVAALYISMGSDFLGVIQLLVYVGGILTLLVFAVMFVAGDDEGDLDAEVEG